MTMVCSFFGHRNILCIERLEEQLTRIIEDLILEGVEMFYVGEMGDFECFAGDILTELKRNKYPHIHRKLIVCYGSQFKQTPKVLCDTFDMPGEVDICKRRGKIHRRNQWVVDHSDIIVCYIDANYGGAYEAYKRAKKKGKRIINLTKIWDEE